MILVNPQITRSRLVLEVASELVGGDALTEVPEYLQASAVLRTASNGAQVTLSSASTAEGIFAVVRREVDLAIINPSAVLGVAARGCGQFETPQPIRAIAVIPSWDQFVFAVRPETELETFEDIARRKLGLRVTMRSTPGHTLHRMFDDVAAAAGFSRDDLERWGGGVHKTGAVPSRGSPTLEGLLRGDVDALFDEAAYYWVDEALEAGIRILPLSEASVQALEKMGYRRAILPKSAFPKLPTDVLTLDFSGWTVFVHAEADDTLVTNICAALEARKMRIPWEGEGPLPVERMAREAPDTPQTVLLHPAAERFWRNRGYFLG
jgi:TRAP-type uncharacterized transport system substrate-binding protein